MDQAQEWLFPPINLKELAVVGYNLKSTQLSRQHNNANILCIGSRLTKKKEVKKIVSAF